MKKNTKEVLVLLSYKNNQVAFLVRHIIASHKIILQRISEESQLNSITTSESILIVWPVSSCF